MEPKTIAIGTNDETSAVNTSMQGRKAVESGLLEFERLRDENANLQQQVRDAIVVISSLKEKVQILEMELLQERNRVSVHQVERDTSVAERVRLEVVFESIGVLIDTARHHRKMAEITDEPTTNGRGKHEESDKPQ